MMMNWFVLTPADRTRIMALEDPANYLMGGRAVDNASPGDGINLNPDATGHTSGAVVSLAGNWVVVKRMVDDPAASLYCPDLVTALLELPFCSLESETIFAPVDPNDV